MGLSFPSKSSHKCCDASRYWSVNLCEIKASHYKYTIQKISREKKTIEFHKLHSIYMDLFYNVYELQPSNFWRNGLSMDGQKSLLFHNKKKTKIFQYKLKSSVFNNVRVSNLLFFEWSNPLSFWMHTGKSTIIKSTVTVRKTLSNLTCSANAETSSCLKFILREIQMYLKLSIQWQFMLQLKEHQFFLLFTA